MAFVNCLPIASVGARQSLCSAVRSSKVRPARAYGVRRVCMTAAPVEGSETATLVELEQFLSDAGDLGTIRFIAISDGAVLETIGRFDYAIKRFNIPNKGTYLTLASEDKTFECHINTAKVVAVSMSKESAKIGGHDLYVIRLKNADGGIVLSCLLMWDPSRGPGEYIHGAIDAFERLRAQYGDAFSVRSA